MLTGEATPELAAIDLELQAALHLLHGDAEQALADDLLRGTVTWAARRPAP